MPDEHAMQRVDDLLTHVWMVRTFIKHSEEAEDDDQLREIQRVLYDYLLALGPTWQAGDVDGYFKQARKKMGKLQAVVEEFAEVQPEISTHMNFQMAVRSLRTAVADVTALLQSSAS